MEPVRLFVHSLHRTWKYCATHCNSYLSLVLTISNFTRDEMAYSALRQCMQPEEMLGVLNAVRVVSVGHSPSNVSGALTGREN
jgi:hypothetical protein